MTIFQIISVLFGLFMLYVVSIHGKKKTLAPIEIGFWASTWVVFIFISLFPNVLLGIVDILRFDRVFDLLLVVALMILSVVVFMSYFAQKEATAKLEQVVRETAIAKANEFKSKSKK